MLPVLVRNACCILSSAHDLLRGLERANPTPGINSRFSFCEEMSVNKKCCVVAELRGGKYWVGTTTNRERYIKDLASRKSAPAYVVKHGFVAVSLVVEDSTCEKVVLEMMRLHGKQNVRGSTFPAATLSANKKQCVVQGIYPDFAATKCATNLYAVLLTDETFFICTAKTKEEALTLHPKAQSIYLTKRAKTLFDEDALVEQLMFTFGVDKVRGGSYSSPSTEQRVVLEGKFARVRCLQ